MGKGESPMSSTREIYSDLRKSRGASAAAALVGEGEACEGDQNAKEQARRREPRWYVRERERACVCVKCAGVSTRRGRGMEGSRGRGRSAERRDPAGVPSALATVFARSVGRVILTSARLEWWCALRPLARERPRGSGFSKVPEGLSGSPARGAPRRAFAPRNLRLVQSS